MFTPTDLIAILSTWFGSGYGAYKDARWPDTYPFRLLIGLQSSVAFLLAFAGMDYVKESAKLGGVPGVSWTAPPLSTPLPVFMYLIILLALVLFVFHATLAVLTKTRPGWLTSKYFYSIAFVCYFFVAYHALTLSISPVDMGSL